MEMGNALAPVLPDVRDQPIPTLDQPLLSSQIASDENQLPDQIAIVISQAVQRNHVSPGNDECVLRRLRAEVLEGHHLGILVDEARRNLTARDSAEDTGVFLGFSHAFLQFESQTGRNAQLKMDQPHLFAYDSYTKVVPRSRRPRGRYTGPAH